jgi:diguanylate cyclase (GGDEF)-like protein/PAS domain S-box-containing protein
MVEDTPRPLLTPSAIPLPLCLTDLRGHIVEVNEGFVALVGPDAAGMAGRPVEALGLVGPDVLRYALEALASGVSLSAEPLSCLSHWAGREAILSVARDGEGRPAGLVILILPTSTMQLAAQERRASFAMESAGQWVWELDLVSDTVWRSPGWQRALGFDEPDSADDAEPWSIVHPEDRSTAADAVERLVSGEAAMFEATYRLRHRDGSWRWFLSRGRIVARDAEGRPGRLLATTIDVHRQKETEAQLTLAMAESAEISRRLAELNSQLTELSDRDGLTGLANRRAFEREWRRQVGVATDRPDALSLLMIDVDYFKQYNDRMGHVAGDQCLRRVAAVLARSSDPGDFVCRYGGEEFAVLLGGAGPAVAEAYAGRVMATIERLGESHPDSPFRRLTVSMGVATLERGETAERLLQRADDALYEAKRGGRNRVQVAAPASGWSASA